MEMEERQYTGRLRLTWILTRGQDMPFDVNVYPAWAALTWRARSARPPDELALWDCHAHPPGGGVGQCNGLAVDLDRGQAQHRAL